MGIGIIALSLWLAYGFNLYFNNISLFPNFIAYLLLMLGLVIVKYRTQNNNIKIAVILCFIEVIYVFVFNVISLLNTVLLFFMFKGIEELAKDYNELKPYKRWYHALLICHIYMMIVSHVSILNITPLSMIVLIGSILLVIVVICHLIRINILLEEEYIIIRPYKDNHSLKKLFIILCLSCMSVVGIVTIKNDYIHLINEEQLIRDSGFYKVDEEEYKLIGLGYYKNEQAHIIGNNFVLEVMGYDLYVKDELLKDVNKVEYRVYDGNRTIIHYSGEYEIIDHSLDGWGGTNPFEGYTGVRIDNRLNGDANIVSEKQLQLSFEIKLYKDEECLYQDYSEAKLLQPRKYSYKDEYIMIDNIQYDTNVIVGIPNIKVNVPECKYIKIYYEYGEGKDYLLNMYSLDEYGYFDCNTFHHLIKAPIKDFQQIRVDLCTGYGEDRYDEKVVIKSIVCHLEEDK